MNVSYKIRVHQPLVLPESCGHLSRCLVAHTSTHFSVFGDHALVICQWHTELLAWFSRLLQDLGREVLLSFESKLLVFF